MLRVRPTCFFPLEKHLFTGSRDCFKLFRPITLFTTSDGGAGHFSLLQTQEPHRMTVICVQVRQKCCIQANILHISLHLPSVSSFIQLLPSNLLPIFKVWSSCVCLTIWATTRQNQQNECSPSEDLDQPGHPPSLITVFAVRMKKVWVLSYLLCAQRRLIRLGGCPGWSESLLDTQSLCWFLSCHGSILRYSAHGRDMSTVKILKFQTPEKLLLSS